MAENANMTPMKPPERLSTRPRTALVWQSNTIVLITVLVSVFRILQFALGAGGAFHLVVPAGVCCVLAAVAWRLRAVTPVAAMTGAVLSLSLTLPSASVTDWWHSPLLVLLTVFVLTHLATRFRRDRKETSGLAETGHGRRASQVAANIGAAVLFLPAMHQEFPSPLLGSFLWPVSAMCAVVAALAEAAADTVSSELGQTLSGQPRMITSGRQVQPGTDGAISVSGTIAGSLAAGIVVLVSMASLGLIPLEAAIAYAGAIFGLFFDSLLGATMERHGWLNNDAVNFLSTLAAAVVGWSLASALRATR